MAVCFSHIVSIVPTQYTVIQYYVLLYKLKLSDTFFIYITMNFDSDRYHKLCAKYIQNIDGVFLIAKL